MSISSGAFKVLDEVPKLDDGNWFVWERDMKMFFLACNAKAAATGEMPTDAAELAVFKKINTQLTAYVNTKISPQYRYIIDGEETASGAWVKLKAHFERSTIGHRMAARKEFYNVSHDPELPIDIYIEAVSAARTKLQAFKCKVEDAEFVDVLLMNLDVSLHGVRATILGQKDEPDIASVKSMLKGASSHIVDVKLESTAVAMAARGYRSAKNRSSPSGPVDDKGYRWCDTTNEDACHRCGRSGHFAARCMYTMPQSVKDWIMETTARSESPPAPSRPNTAAASNMAYANTARALISRFPGSDSDLDDDEYGVLGRALEGTDLLVT